MRFRGDQTYIGEEGRLTIKMARVGIIAGLLIYGLFGIIDPFMVPSQFKTIWLIRFGFVIPSILIVFAFTYTKQFPLLAKLILKTLLFIGEIGILAMIYIAKPNEGAFLAYYAGLILVILWSGFIFRFSFAESTFYFISILIFYNAIALFKQNILSYDTSSLEYGWYIGNNFFLAATGILALIGTNHLDNYFNELRNKNTQLISDQEALETAKNKAQESDKLKTAFLTNMSHEIRTPMNGIIGFSELFVDNESTEEDKAHYAKIVINSGKQLLRIVNDILDLSKIETNQVSIQKRTKDLRIGFKHTYEVFNRICNEKGLELIADFSENEACYINTDHTRLFQVINNLLENAIKFTSTGQIKFGYKSKDKELLIFVKDSGIGISEDYQDLIFERFRQLETSQTRMYSGTGLGLSISKQLILLLNGKLWLESKENKGSTFFISLPPCENSYIDHQNNKRKTRTLSLKSEKHILIAEDEDNNFLLLKIYLKNTFTKIGHAKDGKQAIEYVKNHKDIDLILMDIKMPNINGVEAMQEIRKTNSNIPIIAQTAFVMADDKRKLMGYGFDDYIPKPIESKVLFDMLNDYLA
ncbi:MAG: ATP-binding protein [Bacteroidales bacterium]|jgi:signal transduction histidine kinase|nr:ATP-binding protein [Bacteroidales bacterium]